jgi:hypothetical protein
LLVEAFSDSDRLLPNLDQSLACVLTSIKACDRSRRMFDALQDVFGIAQSSIANPGGKPSEQIDLIKTEELPTLGSDAT